MEDADKNELPSNSTLATTISLKIRDLGLAKPGKSPMRSAPGTISTDESFLGIYGRLSLLGAGSICLGVLPMPHRAQALCEAAFKLIGIRLTARQAGQRVQVAVAIIYFWSGLLVLVLKVFWYQRRWHAAADFVDQCRYLAVSQLVPISERWQRT